MYRFLLVCNSNSDLKTHWFFRYSTLKSRLRVNQGHWKCCHSIDWYGFLSVFYSVFLPKMHRFWDIGCQKFRALANRDRGPSKSLEMSPFDRAHMTSYWRSIVNMALSRVFSETFNVEKYRDLEIWVGHSRSLKSSRSTDWLWFIVFCSNFVTKFFTCSTCRYTVTWTPG